MKQNIYKCWLNDAGERKHIFVCVHMYIPLVQDKRYIMTNWWVKLIGVLPLFIESLVCILCQDHAKSGIL